VYRTESSSPETLDSQAGTGNKPFPRTGLCPMKGPSRASGSRFWPACRKNVMTEHENAR